MLVDSRHIGKMNAKEKIDRYHFRQSALHFQIMLTDATNILYPTDICCKTIDMMEFSGSRPSLNEGDNDASSSKRKRTETEQLPVKSKKSTNARSLNKSGHT